MAELSLIMKALGPGAAALEEGGLDAVRRALATNPSFRQLAVKAAKAWVGEGVEEVSQGATDDAVSYLVRSKSQGELQAGPVVDVEARKQDFVGGLMAGSIFGAGSLAVSASTHAVFKGRDESAAALAPTLADLAANPKAQAMAPELAGLVAAKTAEQGEEVTTSTSTPRPLAVSSRPTRRLTRGDRADGRERPEAVGQHRLHLGQAGGAPRGLRREVGEGRHREEAGRGHATRSDRPTPRELAAQQAADEEFAKKIAAENRAPGDSPTLRPLRRARAAARRLGAHVGHRRARVPSCRAEDPRPSRSACQKVEDLFQNVRVQVDDGGKVLLLEARQAHVAAAVGRACTRADAGAAAERLYIDDHVTSLYTFPAWELMQQESPAKSVATLTLTDIKPVNDSVLGGHDTANAPRPRRPGHRRGRPLRPRARAPPSSSAADRPSSRAPRGREGAAPRGHAGARGRRRRREGAMQMDTGIRGALAGTLPKERGDLRRPTSRSP